MLIFSISGSFTELYVNSLLHLVDHIDDMDEEHMKFLPDLQITETSCNKKDLGKKQFILHIMSMFLFFRSNCTYRVLWHFCFGITKKILFTQ